MCVNWCSSVAGGDWSAVQQEGKDRAAANCGILEENALGVVNFPLGGAVASVERSIFPSVFAIFFRAKKKRASGGESVRADRSGKIGFLVRELSLNFPFRGALAARR